MRVRPARVPARVVGLAAAAFALLLLCFLSLAIGTRDDRCRRSGRRSRHYDPTSTDQLVIVELRMPRTILGLLVGAALGLAGAVMQGVTRNPLADPGILGVNAGAALFVVIAISVFGVSSILGYVWFAFVGAAIASVVVYGIASLGRDGATPVKLALAGAALSAAFGSVTTAFLLLDQATFDQFRFWQVGSLSGRGHDIVAPDRSVPDRRVRARAAARAGCSTRCRSATTSPAVSAPTSRSPGRSPRSPSCCSAARPPRPAARSPSSG